MAKEINVTKNTKKYMTYINQINNGKDIENKYHNIYQEIKQYAKDSGVKMYYILYDVLKFYVENKINGGK